MALAPPERERRLAELRREDGELADRVQRLLALDAAPGGLLDDDLSRVGGLGAAAAGADAEPDDDLAGQMVGPYRLTQRIGRGGMGTVYAAERADGLYQQRVAVKVLTATGSAELLRRFDRERAILASLEHPHIARLLDAGTLAGRPCLVMELVAGVDLVSHCDQRRAGIDERLRLFADVCAAVAFAHQRLVVHRDLKPGNVLVSAAGEVKLLDFGIAALFDPERPQEAMTTVARRAFTPAYAAPEQLLGQPVTTVTDVYALGALLHELLVGAPPPPRLAAAEEGRSPLLLSYAALPAATARSVAAARRLAPRQLAAALRGDLAAIVAVALRPEPARRYRSVQELHDDVLRHLDGRPVAVRGDDRLYRLRSFARRHRAALAASALAASGLVAGMVVALSQAREARSEAERARALRKFLTNELKREAIGDALEPGGPRLAEMFARGLPNVDDDFAGQPEVAAEIHSIAGETFRMLKDPRAVDAFRAALERRRALYGDDDPRVAGARGDLAAALLVHGEVREAQRLLEASARPGVLADEQRGEMLSTLGRAYLLSGDLTAAERARREALALARAPGPRRGARTGDALDRLAAVLYLQGRLRESDRLLGEALPLLRPETHRAPVLWLRRAYARHHRGDLDDAARAYAAARSAGGPATQSWTRDRAACGEALLLAERGDAAAARQALAGVSRNEDTPVSLEYREAGPRCATVAAWLDGDLAALRRTVARPGGTEGPAPVSPADRATRELLLGELLLVADRPAEALPHVEAAALARSKLSDLLPWRRAEAELLRAAALSRLGRAAEGGAEAHKQAAVLSRAVPGHRFLGLWAGPS